MALNQIIDLSTTAGNNLDFIGVGIPEGMFPDKVNDAMRALGKILADAVPRHVAKGAGTYTPAKTDHNQFWRCTGAVTLNLTAAATLTDGWCLWVRGDGGAVTIDPNGAELIDGAATLVIPDGGQVRILCTGTAFFTIFNTGGTYTSTDAGATAGPILTFYRNSATPAAADIAGKILFQGEDSAGNTEDYAEIYQVIDDPTSTSEDARLLLRVKTAGSMGTAATFVGSGQLGTPTNDSATAGNIGEVITASVVSGSAVSLSTGTAKDVTSVSLTAGDWDVTGTVGFFPNAATSITLMQQSISQTSNTHDTAPGSFQSRGSAAFVPGSGATLNVLGATTIRISLASTTTIYLVASSTFTINTQTAYGQIWARRAR